jgi:hypothetical protein
MPKPRAQAAAKGSLLQVQAWQQKQPPPAAAEPGLYVVESSADLVVRGAPGSTATPDHRSHSQLGASKRALPDPDAGWHTAKRPAPGAPGAHGSPAAPDPANERSPPPAAATSEQDTEAPQQPGTSTDDDSGMSQPATCSLSGMAQLALLPNGSLSGHLLAEGRSYGLVGRELLRQNVCYRWATWRAAVVGAATTPSKGSLWHAQ